VVRPPTCAASAGAVSADMAVAAGARREVSPVCDPSAPAAHSAVVVEGSVQPTPARHRRIATERERIDGPARHNRLVGEQVPEFRDALLIHAPRLQHGAIECPSAARAAALSYIHDRTRGGFRRLELGATEARRTRSAQPERTRHR